jgi:hypothetical protein
LSSQSYLLEYKEDFGGPLTAILTMCMFVSIAQIGCFIAKMWLEVQLMIHRKRAHPGSKILNMFKLQNIILEIMFIAIHPSPFLVGIKIWMWEPTIDNYFFYHVNDFLAIIMS